MKLYDFPNAPNPKRVKIFANEKGIELELVTCDMRGGEHKSPEFLKKNPSGKIPVLELDDGRCISESVAICRYLEAIFPEPNLLGVSPFELGYIESRNRHIEFEMWREIGISWVNDSANTEAYNNYDNVDDPRFADQNRGVSNEAASRHQILASYDDLCGGRGGANDRSSGSTGFMLFSEAIVRMQSPAYEDDDGEEFGEFMCNGTHMTCP